MAVAGVTYAVTMKMRMNNPVAVGVGARRKDEESSSEDAESVRNKKMPRWYSGRSVKPGRVDARCV